MGEGSEDELTSPEELEASVLSAARKLKEEAASLQKRKEFVRSLKKYQQCIDVFLSWPDDYTVPMKSLLAKVHLNRGRIYFMQSNEVKERIQKGDESSELKQLMDEIQERSAADFDSAIMLCPVPDDGSITAHDWTLAKCRHTQSLCREAQGDLEGSIDSMNQAISLIQGLIDYVKERLKESEEDGDTLASKAEQSDRDSSEDKLVVSEHTLLTLQKNGKAYKKRVQTLTKRYARRSRRVGDASSKSSKTSRTGQSESYAKGAATDGSRGGSSGGESTSANMFTEMTLQDLADVWTRLVEMSDATRHCFNPSSKEDTLDGQLDVNTLLDPNQRFAVVSRRWFNDEFRAFCLRSENSGKRCEEVSLKDWQSVFTVDNGELVATMRKYAVDTRRVMEAMIADDRSDDDDDSEERDLERKDEDDDGGDQMPPLIRVEGRRFSSVYQTFGEMVDSLSEEECASSVSSKTRDCEFVCIPSVSFHLINECMSPAKKAEHFPMKQPVWKFDPTLVTVHHHCLDCVTLCPVTLTDCVFIDECGKVKRLILQSYPSFSVEAVIRAVTDHFESQSYGWVRLLVVSVESEFVTVVSTEDEWLPLKHVVEQHLLSVKERRVSSKYLRLSSNWNKHIRLVFEHRRADSTWNDNISEVICKPRFTKAEDLSSLFSKLSIQPGDAADADVAESADRPVSSSSSAAAAIDDDGGVVSKEESSPSPTADHTRSSLKRKESDGGSRSIRFVFTNEDDELSGCIEYCNSCNRKLRGFNREEESSEKSSSLFLRRFNDSGDQTLYFCSLPHMNCLVVAPMASLRLGRRIPNGAGLYNFGNTCYLNASLQCLYRVKELRHYFTCADFKCDVNLDNPLGYRGELANLYSIVMIGMQIGHSRSSGRGSTQNLNSCLRHFRAKIGSIDERWLSDEQMDSEEFLSFLLDALNEECSYVSKKQRKVIRCIRDSDFEKKDDDKHATSDTTSVESTSLDLASVLGPAPILSVDEEDEESTMDPSIPSMSMIEMGKDEQFQRPMEERDLALDHFQNAHLARNRSRVVDLFDGQCRSVTICPDCSFESVKYDAFRVLQLPIPDSKSMITVECFVSLKGPNESPTRIPITVSSKASIQQMIDRIRECIFEEAMFISEYQGIPKKKFLESLHAWTNSLLICRMHGYRFVKYYTSARSFGDVWRSIIKRQTKLQSMKKSPDYIPYSSDADEIHLYAYPMKCLSVAQRTERSVCQIRMNFVTNARAIGIVKHASEEEDDTTMVYFTHPTVCEMFYPLTGLQINAVLRKSVERFCVMKNKSDLDRLVKQVSVLMHLLMEDMEVRKLRIDVTSKKPLNPITNDRRRFATFDCVFNSSLMSEFVNLELARDTLVLQSKCDSSSTPVGSGVSSVGSGKNGNVTLRDCLRQYTASEILSSDSVWKCRKCDALKSAPSRQIKLYRLPNVLVIQLKRFQSADSHSLMARMFRQSHQKNQTLIEFPINDLDLSEFLVFNHSSHVYDLAAVILHSGEILFGHYTAICKDVDCNEDSSTPKWFYFDDDRRPFEITDLNQIVNSKAYVLFYRRRN